MQASFVNPKIQQEWTSALRAGYCIDYKPSCKERKISLVGPTHEKYDNHKEETEVEDETGSPAEFFDDEDNDKEDEFWFGGDE